MPLLDFTPLLHPSVRIAGWELEKPDEIPDRREMLKIFLENQNNAKLQLVHLLGITEAPRYATSGKPLPVHGLHLSFTHSGNYLFAAVADQPVGIDLQFRSPKLERIQHKFVTDDEGRWAAEDPGSRLLYLWSAKEAVFKIYGENLPFKDIHCLPDHLEKSGSVTALAKGEQKTVHYSFFDNFCFCLAL